MRLILPETHQSQVQHIQESPKFRPHPDKPRQAVPFPGYTIITPPGPEDAKNATLYETLTQYQNQIAHDLGANLFTPVPSDSLHLTLADLIWDSAFRATVEVNPEFEVQLPPRVTDIFRQCQPLSEGNPIRFQVIGLMVMTRAVAVCLVPTEEHSYDRLLKFRRALYQSSSLIGLGIEQQYYFTPHVTLGYFGTIPPAAELAAVSDRVVALNQQWLDQDPQEFWVHRAELRKFDDMTHYYRDSDWAVFEF